MRTIRMAWACLAFVACLPAAAAPAEPPVDDEPVSAVFKFVKAVPSRQPAARWLPDSCVACAALNDPAYDRENTLETLVALKLPRRRSLELRFAVDPGAVRRVLLQTGDLAFRLEGQELVLAVPPLGHDAVFAGEMATHIVEPGLVLRFEHAHPARRAGAYAAGDFPVLERRAADHLEFAQREFIRSSGLGRHVERQGLGTLMVMGFDTNYPFGHADAPAHMHMHLRWPGNTGTQIGHYYIDADGLLSHNIVGWVGVGVAEKRFGRGETFTTRDAQGRPVYAHTITPEGWLRLSRPGQPACLVRPVAKGFDSGAVLDCPGREAVVVRVQDDQEQGVLRVTSNRIEEVFRYDPDTGRLRSPAAPPPVSESAHPPPMP